MRKLTKMIIIRAVPGAGKSTIAKEMMAKDPEAWVRLNRDDMRLMLKNAQMTPDYIEKMITKTLHSLAESALKKGLNVITDDTNLKQKTVNEWHAIAEKVGNVTVIEKFLDVPLKEAIRRDKLRDKMVGEEVVKRFYDRYIAKLKVVPETYYPPVTREGNYIEQDQSLPKAILCDIDGTIAKMNGKRGPFEWHNVGLDDVNKPVEEFVNILDFSNWYCDEYYYQDNLGVKLIFFSGRDGVCQDETIKWFKDKMRMTVTHGDNLFMRKPNDPRRDSIVKKEMYEKFIKDKYNVLFVLDDRNQVVDMWRQEIGLPCFQVDYSFD